MLSKMANYIFLRKHTIKHLVRIIGLDRISMDMSLIATYRPTLDSHQHLIELWSVTVFWTIFCDWW